MSLCCLGGTWRINSGRGIQEKIKNIQLQQRTQETSDFFLDSRILVQADFSEGCLRRVTEAFEEDQKPAWIGTEA